MKNLVFALLYFVSTVALGGPWLIADPYPTNQPSTAIPTEFVVTISGIAAPVVSPAVDVTGGKGLKLDLGPLNLSGTRTVTAKARNSWGESAASAALTFTAGPPTAPTGLGLSAQ